jgi:hypothetical protein
METLNYPPDSFSSPGLRSRTPRTLSREAWNFWTGAEGDLQLGRWVATTLGIPALCDSRTCRRARACHGDPQDCGPRYAPLVPEDAREGMRSLIEGKMSGLDFDELSPFAMAELVDLREWQERVETTYRGRHTRRRRFPK